MYRTPMASEEKHKFNRIQVTMNVDPLFFEVLEIFQEKYNLRSRGFTFDYIVHTHPETASLLDAARRKMWSKKGVDLPVKKARNRKKQ